MKNKDIRLENMLRLADEFGSLEALAEKTGTAPSYLSQIKNKAAGRGMGDRLARKFEALLKKPEGWMDQKHLPLPAVGEDKNLLQLIELYSQLNETNQAKVLQEVNFLHNLEYPHKSPSNPYANLSNKHKVIAHAVHEPSPATKK